MERVNLIVLLNQSPDFDTQVLNSLVHNAAITKASKVCDSGLNDQIDYLLESGLSTVEILSKLKKK
ncbi:MULTISPECIES: hypothetical protein [Vibrio]|uniref:Uncharacterized protein n=2 Tax=Vibrio TaxID=662 RepID=A0A510IGF9_9VIBR|nr:MULTISPECIES: hypothetical protein [Vibrio]RTZ20316.1 hypothetical protein EKN09_24545 [Vibrio penaeicida]BBL92238.1 hypothetical protein VroAM7_48910 [Vibrio rotiferianus]GLQ71146.1 hypothetical protein GCM10007932_05060 [Vibrio penaeicida]CCN40038.1 hypothetical protein VIBNIFTn2_120020 [Vibrio nigripulchritudo FTn2]